MAELDWAVDTADELISEFGKSMSFYREEPDLTDAAKPWKPDGVYPDEPLRTIVDGVTVPYSERMIDGTVIVRGDLRCYVAAKNLKTYAPRPGDYAEFSGQKFKVVNVTKLEPGPEKIMYDVQLRG